MLARPVDSFPWRPASPECGKPRQPHGRLFLSHPGASRGLGGRFGNRTRPKTKLPCKGLTVLRKPQTIQRYNTGPGLTLREKLSNDINE